jgi:hypothetical protein
MGALAVATISVMTERRVLFLIVPIGAFVGWSTPRVSGDRRVSLSVLGALTVIACALAADWVATTWGFIRLGVPAGSVLGHPSGVLRFLMDNVWRPTDGALTFAGALVAALLSWPSAAGRLATSPPGSPVG